MEIKAKGKRQKAKVTQGAKSLGRIGVLMGGPSSEKNISLKSGKAVYKALKNIGCEVAKVIIRSENKKENIGLIRSKKIDCAFLALHGRFGEDGSIQSILESMDLAYTGSGVNASRLAMDKIASYRIFKAGGLNIARGRVLKKKSYRGALRFARDFGFPIVIKPACGGSSIGLSIVTEEQGLKKALNTAFSFDRNVIVEEYIKGRELTVAILEGKALPMIEIIPKRMFFDYQAKYTKGLTTYVAPAKLDEGIAKRVKDAALLAHKLLGCHGCSRVDIILNESNEPFVLEVNTIPGFTDTSLLPKAARCVGVEFDKLCVKLIELAYEKKQR